LIDAKFAARVAAALPPTSAVIEIGAGTGTLTAALVRRARTVTALEIDRDLVEILHERFAAEGGHLHIVPGDALEFDFAKRLRAERAPRAICGNLPYNITTPLIERIVACADVWEASVFMVQREYGRRLSAAPKTPEYGSLTLFVGHYCRCEKLFDIGAAGFYPRPNIASTVVRLVPRPDRLEGVPDEPLLLWLIRAAFAQRRKMLAKSAASHANDPQARGFIEQAMRSAGISETARAEELGLDDFRRVARALKEAGFAAPG